MALVNCSECNTKISDLATNCPKCGAPVDLVKIKNKKNKTTTGCLIIIGVIMMISVVSAIFTPENSKTTESTKETEIIEDEDKSLEAYVFSQQVVEENLKSPSSAEYPTFSDISVKKEGNIYTINAYVDSQNSFGAMIRNKYKCVLIENDNLYKVVDLSIK